MKGGVVKFVQEFYEFGRLSKAVTESFIALILKANNP